MHFLSTMSHYDPFAINQIDSLYIPLALEALHHRLSDIISVIAIHILIVKWVVPARQPLSIGHMKA